MEFDDLSLSSKLYKEAGLGWLDLERADHYLTNRSASKADSEGSRTSKSIVIEKMLISDLQDFYCGGKEYGVAQFS